MLYARCAFAPPCVKIVPPESVGAHAPFTGRAERELDQAPPHRPKSHKLWTYIFEGAKTRQHKAFVEKRHMERTEGLKLSV